MKILLDLLEVGGRGDGLGMRQRLVSRDARSAEGEEGRRLGGGLAAGHAAAALALLGLGLEAGQRADQRQRELWVLARLGTA